MAKQGGSPLNITGVNITNTNNTGKLQSGDIKSIFSNANNSSSYKFSIEKTDHSLYDDKTYNEVIEHLKGSPSTYVDEKDFAYLKYIGVYPTNRLVIARRFPSGIESDLSGKTVSPIATMVSWVKETENFLKFNFGEEYTEAEANFTDVINDVGKDMTTNISAEDNSNKWGTAMASAAIVPLAGFTDIFQYEVMRQLGYTTAKRLPLGDPNLIKESKRRKTGSSDSPGSHFSGLKGQFSVKMVVEYEQKYIFGIDPTVVHYSIIANALAFGTSNSTFQLSGKFSNDATSFFNKLGNGDSASLSDAISLLVTAITDTLGALGSVISTIFEGKDKASAEVADNKKENKVESKSTIFSGVLDALAKGIGSIINKYKVRLLGVITSLTGAPSGPYHVTIGNPFCPLISCGDMIVDNVEIELGTRLAYNDLPSSVKVTFELKSARNLGAQEIYERFNSGKARYKRLLLTNVETISESNSESSLDAYPKTEHDTNNVATAKDMNGANIGFINK